MGNPAEGSEDERVTTRSPMRRSFSPNENPWSADDPGGLPELDVQSTRGPPTSSSAGRDSDADEDLHHVGPLSSGSASPIGRYKPQSFIGMWQNPRITVLC